MQKTKGSPIKYLFIILAVIACAVIITSLGAVVTSPFSTSMNIESVVSSTVDSSKSTSAGVIVDQGGSRLLFINADGSIARVHDANILADRPQSYTCAASCERGMYVIEIEHENNSPLVSCERIARYDTNGTRIGTVLEYSYENDESMPVEYGRIASVITQGEKGYAVVKAQQTGTFSIVEFSTDSETANGGHPIAALAMPDNAEPVYAAYDPRGARIIATDALGRSFEASIPFAGWTATEVSGNLHNALGIEIGEQGKAHTIDGFRVEGEQIQLTPLETIRSLAFWTSVAYLLALIIAIFIYQIVISIRTHNYAVLEKGAAVIASACVVIGVSAYVASNLASENLAGKANAMLSTASAITTSAHDDLIACLNEYESTKTLSPSTSVNLSRLLKRNTINASHANVYCNYTLTSFGPSEEALGIGSSSGDTLVGWSDNTLSRQMESLQRSQGEPVINTFTSLYLEEYYVSVPILNSQGNLSGALIAHASTMRVLSSTFNRVFAILAALISALIMVSFVLLESKEWSHSFKLRAKLMTEKNNHPEMALCRPIRFLCIAATSVDSALLVVFADEMAKASGMEGGALLASIPLVAQSFGYTVGAPLYNLMARRMPPRRLLITTCLVCIACYLGCSASVAANNIIGLVVTLFFASSFNDVLLNFTGALPMHSRSSIQRSELNRSLSAAKISATALAILLAGVLAQTFGNPFAYLLGAGITVITLLFTLAFIPKSYEPAAIEPSKGRAKTGLGGILHFICDAPIAAVLLFMTVPLAIASGYKSFLFPLFAASEGMDKSMISGIVAMCNALVFYAVPLLSKVESRMGSKALMSTFTAMIAAFFALFVANDTIIWAVITLVASSLIIKIVEPAIASFWQDRCVTTGADPSIAQSTMSVFESGADTLRSPVLGGLLQAFGQSLACTILGAYCAACVFMFTSVSSIKTKRDRTNDPSKYDMTA